MRGMTFVSIIAVILAADCVSIQNEMPLDSTGRPSDSLKPAATATPKAQPSPTAKAVAPKPSTDMPPDTATILHDNEPTMITQGPAEYPRLARQGKFTATVTVKAYIDTTGTVLKAKAVKCTRPGMGFDEAAVKSAYRSTFKPAMYKGRPVAIWYTYEVNFK